VAAGQPVHFVADGHNFDGKVARVSPTIDPVNRSVTVYVQVPNASGALKGGTVRQRPRRAENSQRRARRAYARAASVAGERAHLRLSHRRSQIDVADVQLGIVDERAGKGRDSLGLNDGDRVVVGNVGTLGRGMQVTVLGTEDPSSRGGIGGGRGNRTAMAGVAAAAAAAKKETRSSAPPPSETPAARRRPPARTSNRPRPLPR
jgi:hypothetical protein